MPRGKRKASPVLSQQELKKKAKWGGYIDCPLGAEERKGFIEWFEGEKPDIWALLHEVTDAGFTFSLLRDEANEAYVARLFYVLPESKKSHMLTAFHGSPEESTALVLYKHFMILFGEWESESDETNPRMEWG